MAKTPFKLRSSNTTPFKQMGSSPLKQDYTEALEHHKEYKATKASIHPKTSRIGNITNDPIHKEINRLARGGKPKYDQIMAKQRATDAAKVTKVAKKGIWKGAKKVGGFLLGKVALPAMAIYNSPKLAEKHGLRKFVGSMIWDENLLLTKKERGGTGDPIGIESKNWQQKLSKYNDDGTLKNK